MKKGMPFTATLEEHTKFMSLDTWLERQIKERNRRLLAHPKFSKQELAAYESGLIDMALDVKNEIKRLDG